MNSPRPPFLTPRPRNRRLCHCPSCRPEKGDLHDTSWIPTTTMVLEDLRENLGHWRAAETLQDRLLCLEAMAVILWTAPDEFLTQARPLIKVARGKLAEFAENPAASDLRPLLETVLTKLNP
jgi:hypothetical protein